ncbi:MAG: hypothetical protein AB7P76_09780 [Candidatus Melainabacteria bacterium]
MKVYQLVAAQELPISLETAWDFFSNPANLPRITPPWLGFRVESTLPPRMYPGMVAWYKVMLLGIIPTTWVTEIPVVQEPFFFIDEQRFGPYKLWYHQHRFEAITLADGRPGVRVTDDVTYIMPFGIFGRLVHFFVVRHQLADIFRFRERVLAELFSVETA